MITWTVSRTQSCVILLQAGASSSQSMEWYQHRQHQLTWCYTHHPESPQLRTLSLFQENGKERQGTSVISRLVSLGSCPWSDLTSSSYWACPGLWHSQHSWEILVTSPAHWWEVKWQTGFAVIITRSCLPDKRERLCNEQIKRNVP